MLSGIPFATQLHCHLKVHQAKCVVAAFDDVWPPNVSVGKACNMQLQGKQYASDGCLKLCQ